MRRFSRRDLLGYVLALSAAPILVTRANQGERLFISAASTGDDKHWVRAVSWRDNSVSQRFALPLPARGHHVALHPQGRYFVAVARRPGTWLVLGDAATGTLIDTLQVPADRHLFGHGVFSADGQQFYTTESNFNDLNGDSGLVVSWDVSVDEHGLRLQRGLEFASHGVGPHELLLMPDQRVIAIANGGIRTHPAQDRDNLNIATMLPSLAYIDRFSGALLEQQLLPEQWHQASIRHFDVNAQGLIALGMQFEGEPWMDVPLLATHRRGEPLRLLSAPQPLQGQMQQYVGSVRFAGDGTSFVASCPRGNLLTFWDSVSGELLDSTRSRDGCGVCAIDGGFIFSAGTGRMAWYDSAARKVHELEVPADLHVMWDNHLSQL